MGETILYTADLHGNKIQYEKLFAHAISSKASAVFIGGDLTPKDIKNRTIDLQKKFLTQYLLPKILEFRKQAKYCSVFLIMGNDDFRANYDFLKSNENGFKVLNSKPTTWKQYLLFGYSYVPFTPFIYKDWEKADLINKNETNRKDIVLQGLRSSQEGLVKHTISLDQRDDSIEKDLNNMLATINTKNTILVVHTPPFGTSLDMMKNQRHVGSEAVKKIIEEKQPLLTMHGHIHECVEESGMFIENLLDLSTRNTVTSLLKNKVCFRIAIFMLFPKINDDSLESLVDFGLRSARKISLFQCTPTTIFVEFNPTIKSCFRDFSVSANFSNRCDSKA